MQFIKRCLPFGKHLFAYMKKSPVYVFLFENLNLRKPGFAEVFFVSWLFCAYFRGQVNIYIPSKRKDGKSMDEELLRILKYLPEKVSAAVYSFAVGLHGRDLYISEIRLRANAPLSISYGSKNIYLFNAIAQFAKSLKFTLTTLRPTLTRLVTVRRTKVV